MFGLGNISQIVDQVNQFITDFELWRDKYEIELKHRFDLIDRDHKLILETIVQIDNNVNRIRMKLQGSRFQDGTDEEGNQQLIERNGTQ